VAPTSLRIIGGTLRGRKLDYSGLRLTRPMKDRVREAVFNILGPRVVGTRVLDLFAGTGALGLEALSRGAARAIFVERHLPTSELLRENLDRLDLTSRSEIVFGDTFQWWSDRPSWSEPWLAFVSPPYAFYRERAADMQALVDSLVSSAPPQSLVVVETDADFDPARLPDAETWDARRYSDTQIMILEKTTNYAVELS